jgi:hypothetical protein
MAQVYFHCFTTRGMLIDRKGASFDDLIEAREGAAAVLRSMLTTPIAAIGSCMSAMRSTRRSSFCLSHSCSARCKESRLSHPSHSIAPLLPRFC